MNNRLKNLKLLRAEKGVSQQKVADAINSNQQSIHRYENGDYQPDIETLIALADYFDTSIDYIVGRTDIRNRIERVDKYSLNKEEAKLIDNFRDFSPEYKKYQTVMMSMLTDIRDKD